MGPGQLTGEVYICVYISLSISLSISPSLPLSPPAFPPQSLSSPHLPHTTSSRALLRCHIGQELLGQKKSMHINAFRLLTDELSRDLRCIADKEGAEARLAADSERNYMGKRYTVEGFLDRIVGLVVEVVKRHEKRAAAEYTDDGAFKGMVQEMLDARAMAEILLRLYLEDHSRGIYMRMWTSLREAHRELIAFRTRAMAGLKGEARRAAAERLCVMRGYAVRGVGEVNDAGEDPLVCAAADGTVGAAGVALLLEAGATTGGEALVAAAKHGQREAVEVLIGSGVHVDSRAKEVIRHESS
jgi:hypothetical protein